MNDYTQKARTVHTVIRIVNLVRGAAPEPHWEKLEQSLRDSVIKAVRVCTEKNCKTPQDCHNAFIETKMEQGWQYGPVKIESEKRSPLMIPFTELPLIHQKETSLFCAILNAVNGVVDAPDYGTYDHETR